MTTNDKPVNDVQDPSEAPEEPLHDKKGNLTLHGMMVLTAALKSSQEHNTIDLNINKFKKFLRGVPGLTKHMFNEQVKAYKQRAWGEYKEVINFKGSFPTVKEY